ncbi:Hsp20/alpha crystallin family protein [Ferruginibacter sp. HRS2-29]|uniref:Hsp20/alpha crystallin family protein n=1 Tax=Ferruginibacter sp. HRS2-29 TaxID=2487334 RepID=UPI0020CD09BB|nr:Hsp20/alpha crystallin family protein [Ferruginibacter sp. HRS2-29]MCP9753164.1 Hsp20/alpha crystallin family protein [Ferruginibacter sp. HRS2-29]
MQTKALVRPNGNRLPAVFNDFFKPWNEWFDDSGLLSHPFNVPAVNITELDNEFRVSLAVPGMKKDDFKIDLDGNMLTISSEKEETKEEKEKKYTRKEYSYTSFSRSFTLPDDVSRDKIDARYEDGVLQITIPRLESKKHITRKINVQ